MLAQLRVRHDIRFTGLSRVQPVVFNTPPPAMNHGLIAPGLAALPNSRDLLNMGYM